MKKLYTCFLLMIFMISAFSFTSEAISKPEITSKPSLINNENKEIIDTDVINKSDKIKMVNDKLSSKIIEGNNVFLYCTLDNNDCIFIIDNIIPSLEKKYKLDNLNVNFIDIGFLGEDFSKATLKREWSLETIPTLQLINYSEGNKNIINSLTWSKDNPVTINNVENWLLDVGHLEPLTVTPKGDAIEKPLK